MFRKYFFAFVFLLGCLCCFNSNTSAQQVSAKPPESDAQTVKALLDEVRQLRQVLQRNSVATYRAQVTLERLRLQQTQVNELIKEQTELRENIKEMERHVSQIPGQLAELEKMSAAAATPTERNEREMMLKGIKGEMENAKLRIQDLREREPQITARLQTEHAKLAELNESLDKLERELENAAGEKGKRP
jgi:DNA repair exonuclease SbcCD ATPase subunit